jgi:hypothetical protein
LLFLDAELVAKGFTTNRTNDAIAVGQFTPAVFSSVTLWAIKSMEYQGIHYWRYFYPRGILNPLVKK